MGIDDSRTPIVTEPLDLILSMVGLAASTPTEKREGAAEKISTEITEITEIPIERVFFILIDLF